MVHRWVEMSSSHSPGDSPDEKWEALRVSDGSLRWTRKNPRRPVPTGRKCLLGPPHPGDGTHNASVREAHGESPKRDSMLSEQEECFPQDEPESTRGGRSMPSFPGTSFWPFQKPGTHEHWVHLHVEPSSSWGRWWVSPLVDNHAPCLESF